VRFIAPGDMPDRIRQACLATGQDAPNGATSGDDEIIDAEIVDEEK